MCLSTAVYGWARHATNSRVVQNASLCLISETAVGPCHRTRMLGSTRKPAALCWRRSTANCRQVCHGAVTVADGPHQKFLARASAPCCNADAARHQKPCRTDVQSRPSNCDHTGVKRCKGSNDGSCSPSEQSTVAPIRISVYVLQASSCRGTQMQRPPATRQMQRSRTSAPAKAASATSHRPVRRRCTRLRRQVRSRGTPRWRSGSRASCPSAFRCALCVGPSQPF